MFMPRQAQAEENEEIDVYEIVFGHIEDAYEMAYHGHRRRLHTPSPLP